MIQVETMLDVADNKFSDGNPSGSNEISGLLIELMQKNTELRLYI